MNPRNVVEMAYNNATNALIKHVGDYLNADDGADVTDYDLAMAVAGHSGPPGSLVSMGGNRISWKEVPKAGLFHPFDAQFRDGVCIFWASGDGTVGDSSDFRAKLLAFSKHLDKLHEG